MLETKLESLEEALQVHESRVDDLKAVCQRLTKAVSAWKKACVEGDVGARQRAQSKVEELLPLSLERAQEASSSWEFDSRAYLESGRWREDVQAAADSLGVKVIIDGETLVSSPVLVRSQPSGSRLKIGKNAWSKLHPRAVAAELKRLRDKKSVSGPQEFLECLYLAWQDLTKNGATVATFQEIYERFAAAPGWKKENSPAQFGQDIYALARSEVRLTRSGKRFHLEHPSAKVKERDVFTVYREDGQPVRYYGIEFR
ncbi:MAG: hypothetical protein KF760_19645 [Candidatus Eremiobacteraeota bacterium]|nr:hypothetical protein [Candidatus Eremiobacteraeota bacterium]MCW5872894.1 hypothetical protein [Candidatus Eremiobacteraeota bacterium]